MPWQRRQTSKDVYDLSTHDLLIPRSRELVVRLQTLGKNYHCRTPKVQGTEILGMVMTEHIGFVMHLKGL